MDVPKVAQAAIEFTVSKEMCRTVDDHVGRGENAQIIRSC